MPGRPVGLFPNASQRRNNRWQAGQRQIKRRGLQRNGSRLLRGASDRCNERPSVSRIAADVHRLARHARCSQEPLEGTERNDESVARQPLARADRSDKQTRRHLARASAKFEIAKWRPEKYHHGVPCRPPLRHMFTGGLFPVRVIRGTKGKGECRRLPSSRKTRGGLQGLSQRTPEPQGYWNRARTGD